MSVSAFTHNAPDPLPVPEAHTYDVTYVAVKRGRITVVEPDTIEEVVAASNANKGEWVEPCFYDGVDSAKAIVHYPSHTQTELELLISNCLLPLDPKSEAYLNIIESFHEFRSKHGTPDTLAMIFRLGQLNPTK